jgi:hypothetical protein
VTGWAGTEGPPVQSMFAVDPTKVVRGGVPTSPLGADPHQVRGSIPPEACPPLAAGRGQRSFRNLTGMGLSNLTGMGPSRKGVASAP